MKSVAVIGIGRFGETVALELAKMGFDVVAMDNNEQVINGIADKVSHAMILDATDKQALIDAGVGSFETVVVGIGENLQASILATLLLKERGVKNVITRALDSYHGMILEKIGADRIVYPEQEVGQKVARTISNPGLIDFIELADEYAVVEIQAPEEIAGSTLADLQLRKKYGVNVVALKRGARIMGAPGPDDVILKGDVIIVSGAPENIEKIKNI